MHRLLILAFGLTGCQWLLGGDASECARDTDCPADMVCDIDRCVIGVRPVDMDPVEAQMDATLDMLLPDMTPPLDQAVIDMHVDAALVDAALPAEIEPVFPDGRCFDGAGMIELARGDTLIPRGLCTPYGVVWTRSGADGARLAVSRTVPVADLVAHPIDRAAQITTADGRFIAWHGPNEDGVSTPMVLDLAARAPTPVELRPIAVTEVQRGRATTAYVHAGGVFVHPDAEDFATFVDCSMPDQVQWGVALSGARVAFFERAARGGPAQLVIADTATCRNRVIHATEGAVDRDARVLRIGARWVWLARAGSGPTVRALVPDARGRLRPTAIALEVPPLEIAGEGDWLVGVGYQTGAYRIDALNLAQNRYRALSEGASNHRRPHLWNGQLTWAAMIRQRWGVQYVTLDQ